VPDRERELRDLRVPEFTEFGGAHEADRESGLFVRRGGLGLSERLADFRLEPRLRELAILVTARELDNQFEWTAHEPVALKEGLDPRILDIVKLRKPVSGAPEMETAIIGFGRELFRDRKVRPQTYAEMVRVFGQTAVVNITALMANYALTAVMLTAFDQQLHEGTKPLLPLP